MNNERLFIYIFITGAALLLSGMGLWFTSIIPGFDRWNKRFFLSFFSVLMLTCVLSLIETTMRDYAIMKDIISLVIVAETLFMSLPLPMLTIYLLHCCGENFRSSRLFHIVSSLWGIYFILLIISQFTVDISRMTPGLIYYRWSWYPLLLLPMTLIMLLNLTATLQRRNRLSRKTFISLLVAILPMAVSLIIHMFVDILPIVDISLTLSVLSMYSLILSEQIEQDLRHQREIALQQQKIANQRASIMVLQMRPHFILNTLTSIYCLCDQDPGLARQVVMDFTTYLRKNFTAIASDSTIPFTSELEHTRAYLAVEHAQYEDSLSVTYDTPHTRFRVPPLTLQPIVENAVKHGRDVNSGVLHIFIKTQKTDSGSEIIVADDGRGYNTSTDDDKLHIALKNIDQRLEMMCGGSLTITPNQGSGTVVSVTIPDCSESSDRFNTPSEA